MTGELARLATVTWWSIRGSVRGLRMMGLVAFAAVPSVIVLALVSVRPAANALANAAEGLFASLTVPVVGMLIVLVISVGQFRNEIDAETLVYLSDRSVSRATVVVGKYLGAVGASLVLVVPAVLLPLGLAEWGGATPYSAQVPFVLIFASVLAVLGYAAFFLFLGLVSRSALIIGLIYGFLWEELLPLLPGEVPHLTLVYYLRSFLSGEFTTGPLAGYSSAVPIPFALAALLLVPVVFVSLGAGAFSLLETAPERESA